MGELLLAQKKPKEALAEFRASLASASGRAISLFGTVRAAKGAGDRKTETEAGEILARNRRKADTQGYTPLETGGNR